MFTYRHISTMCIYFFSATKKWYTIHATWINYSYPNSVYVHIYINMYMDLIVSSTIT